jgi:hypothetical protein
MTPASWPESAVPGTAPAFLFPLCPGHALLPGGRYLARQPRRRSPGPRAAAGRHDGRARTRSTRWREIRWHRWYTASGASPSRPRSAACAAHNAGPLAAPSVRQATAAPGNTAHAAAIPPPVLPENPGCGGEPTATAAPEATAPGTQRDQQHADPLHARKSRGRGEGLLAGWAQGSPDPALPGFVHRFARPPRRASTGLSRKQRHHAIRHAALARCPHIRRTPPAGKTRCPPVSLRSTFTTCSARAE